MELSIYVVETRNFLHDFMIKKKNKIVSFHLQNLIQIWYIPELVIKPLPIQSCKNL